MNKLKIVGALITVVCSSLFGITAANRLKEREKGLNTLLFGIKTLKNKLTYEKNELKILLPQIFGESVNFDGKNGGVSVNINGLNAEDKTLIRDFFDNLGRSVSGEEIKRCECFEKVLETRLYLAKEAINKNSKIYVTAGICSGLAVSVMII